MATESSLLWSEGVLVACASSGGSTGNFEPAASSVPPDAFSVATPTTGGTCEFEPESFLARRRMTTATSSEIPSRTGKILLLTLSMKKN
jgi:hypothetical protein